ncbi:MAG: FecR domain-containing protein [Planctomycetes bacterium]|nr:FecR domain-containing protein [Planctomycetota bacterium]
MSDLPPLLLSSTSPGDDHTEGRRRAVDGLLRSMLGARHSQAGQRAMAALRTAPLQAAQDRVATAQIRAASGRARSPSSSTASHRRARPAPSRSHRTTLMQGTWAAATVAAVVIVLVFAGRSAGDRDDAQVVAVSGTVITSRAGRLDPVRDAMIISRGELVTIGVNSSLRLLWRDGTMLVCGADTRVQIEREGAGKRLRLLAGRLDADVAPQPVDAPLRITSDDAAVTVLGTRLSLSLRDTGTNVTVARGRVEVRRLSDGVVAEVAGGQQLAVAATGPLRSETTPVVASANAAAVGTGLFGQYFNDIEMTQPVFSRIDRDLYFNFGRDSSPDPRIKPSTFAIRWTGQLQPKVSGRHVILCQVDDGVRIRIDGRLIMEDWRVYEPRWIRAEVDLDAGRRHALEVEYYQDKERTVIQLWWQAKGVPQEIIPTSQLFPIRPPGAIDG